MRQVLLAVLVRKNGDKGEDREREGKRAMRIVLERESSVEKREGWKKEVF